MTDETNIIRIYYPNGNAMISLEKFFPCSQKDLKKLNKWIDMDWQNSELLHIQVDMFFRNSIQRLDEMMKSLVNQYGKNMEERAYYRDRVECGTYTNGIPLTPKQRADYKKLFTEYQRKAKANERDFERCKKAKEWFKKQVGDSEDVK